MPRKTFKSNSSNDFYIVESNSRQISEASDIEEQNKNKSVEFTIEVQSNIDQNDDFEIVESIEKEQQQQQYKKPFEYIALEGLEENKNENNFSIISAGLLQIMCDMLHIMPQSSSDIISSSTEFLKPGIFIMLAMDKNEKKRLYSYKLFLILTDRNIYITSSREKEYLIYAMCNQLYQFCQNDEKFFEYTISILINNIFTFNSSSDNLEMDYQYIKQFIPNIVSHISYINLLIALIYTARMNLVLLHKCLQFLTLLFDFNEISSKIDYFLYRSALLQVLFNLLHYFTVENVNEEVCDDNSSQNASLNINSNRIISDLKELFCAVIRTLFKQPDNIDIVQKIENYSYLLNVFINYTYDSVNIGKLTVELFLLILNFNFKYQKVCMQNLITL